MFRIKPKEEASLARMEATHNMHLCKEYADLVALSVVAKLEDKMYIVDHEPSQHRWLFGSAGNVLGRTPKDHVFHSSPWGLYKVPSGPK